MARIGIRREDKSRWERRTPLTPSHVEQIVGQGVEVIVQPSSIRTFTDAEYQHAGAAIHESLTECPVVFGVKEMPLGLFEPGGTYVFFSHTHKAQAYNMPMLRRIIDLGCTLIDYELILGDDGQRLIFFGRYAGLAGMIDTLWALGRRLAQEGLQTPFASLRRAWEYSDLEAAREDVSRVSRQISRDGLPEGMPTLVCGFSGYGRVSLGAQEIYDLLPVHEIDPEELRSVRTQSGSHAVYKAVFYEKHMYRRRDGGEFSFDEFVAAPDLYEADFERFLPHLDLLVHGIYWEERFPKLIRREALREAWSDGRRPRLRVIGDITCDIGGSIDCTVQPADQDHPTYLYDPETGTADRETLDGPGPLVLAVDNLPCELPRDASDEFGHALAPFVARIARAHGPEGLDPALLPEPIRGAIIVDRGRLTEPHRHLEAHLPPGD